MSDKSDVIENKTSVVLPWALTVLNELQSRKKQNYRVLAREKSLLNKNKIVEEKGWDDVKLFEQRLI